MKIVALVGSNRSDSYNKKLALFMKERYQAKLSIELVPIDQLPIYNQDDELNPPDIVKLVKAQIADSDGVLMLTPEYNHSISAVLKNALDWCSRVEQVLVNKPTMVAGASMGLHGTVRAQMHLRDILNSPGVSALVLPGNEIFVGVVHEKIDEAGQLIDQPTIEFIDQVVDRFIKWIHTVKK
ncbi:NAD(P)H-dependent FMN reductase [Seinonella peptonophila]|uniref:NAD(P)H-dependent FMN reductase n=1 Tax=Seinonella peptonophila TaxID=112248 RepID=A0A1M4XJQ4_9BACL|nr:NADPH-dependent FMN reductase [Seinonella peptonophila]SHE93640.1 NAD(P)H-dependent FMN reductase [Seinonella peptonophila]